MCVSISQKNELSCLTLLRTWIIQHTMSNNNWSFFCDLASEFFIYFLFCFKWQNICDICIQPFSHFICGMQWNRAKHFPQWGMMMLSELHFANFFCSHLWLHAFKMTFAKLFWLTWIIFFFCVVYFCSKSNSFIHTHTTVQRFWVSLGQILKLILLFSKDKLN